ncbi:MAG: 50S ribosomal protein L3 [Patescibacteria group bacterium]
MKFIIGKKIEMTQVFDEKNNIVPVTKVLVEKNVITQIKTEEKESVNAVQISSGAKKNLNKPLLGHYKDLGNFAVTRDFSVDNVADYKVGDEVKIDSFEIGDMVSVIGTSKGRGFAGVVKRHHFAGHHATRGTKDQERTSGSIGAGGFQRVIKGKRMAGRMGNDRVTVKNLKVVKIDKENNILFIKGAVPGARNSMVMVRTEK